jgi:hypothetical protein
MSATVAYCHCGAVGETWFGGRPWCLAHMPRSKPAEQPPEVPDDEFAAYEQACGPLGALQNAPEVPAPTQLWVLVKPDGTLRERRPEYRKEDATRVGKAVRYVRACDECGRPHEPSCSRSRS